VGTAKLGYKKMVVGSRHAASPAWWGSGMAGWATALSPSICLS